MEFDVLSDPCKDFTVSDPLGVGSTLIATTAVRRRRSFRSLDGLEVAFVALFFAFSAVFLEPPRVTIFQPSVNSAGTGDKGRASGTGTAGSPFRQKRWEISFITLLYAGYSVMIIRGNLVLRHTFLANCVAELNDALCPLVIN